MKWFVCSLGIVALLFFQCSYSVFGSNKGESTTAQSEVEDKTEPPKKRFVKRQTVSKTFLDTLNAGKEYGLAESNFNDISSQGTNSDSVLAQNDTEIFHVQIMASSKIEKVRTEKKKLAKIIDKPCFIKFESPYYKLLVGNFAKRNDANVMLAKLKKMGYGDAWVVKKAPGVSKG